MRRKAIRLLGAFFAVFMLISATAFAVNEDVEPIETPAPNTSSHPFPDIEGHWAEDVMMRACQDGIIKGVSDNVLSPDGKVNTAQVITIVIRALEAGKTADISKTNIPADAWYAHDAAKALYLGIITGNEDSYTAPISRKEAFKIFGKAFQMIEADPDTTKLEGFSDGSRLYGEDRQIVASMINHGVIKGGGESLNINSEMSRAELVTILYRICPNFIDARGFEPYDEGTIIRGDIDLSQQELTGDVWLNCVTKYADISGTEAGLFVVRSHELSKLVITESTRIDRLVLAQGKGDIEIPDFPEAVINSLVVGDGSGKVILGDIGTVEVTGRGRKVEITGEAERVIVSGASSSVSIGPDAVIGELILTETCDKASVAVGGKIKKLIARGEDISYNGYGTIDFAEIHAEDADLTGFKEQFSVKEIVDKRDGGIKDVAVSLNAPDSLPPGEELRVSANIAEGVARGKSCTAKWYLDGELVFEEEIILGPAWESKITHSFPYSQEMQTSAHVKFVLSHTTRGGKYQEKSAEKTINIENYSQEHYDKYLAEKVLELVTASYAGDYTTAWAEANDYEDIQKEIWVNAKGYSSDTDYLVWVNLTYQRVNIFEGSQGNWKLIRSGLVGTGAAGSPTPVGVWKTTYKQSSGWTTGSYTVTPVVRFKGGGYAFHSRLYYPNTRNLKDASIGFPVSAGCIRMYQEDIDWMHDYLPDGSTVVVH